MIVMTADLKTFAPKSPAKKTRISDINSGKFFPGSKEDMKPSYLITQLGEKFSKVDVVATVVEKFESGEKNFSSITVDDGNDSIRVRAFEEAMEILRPANVGSLVKVVGKVKNFNGENYIIPEILKQIDDPNFENMRSLEILKNLADRKKIADEILNFKNEMSEEELKTYAKEKYDIDEEIFNIIIERKSQTADYIPKILELIEDLDDGSGTSIGKIFESTSLDEKIVSDTISNLISSGLVYEPTVGKLKKV